MEVQDDEVTYIGNDVIVGCVVILSGVKDGDDVDVSVSWMKGSTPFTGVTDRVTINSPVTQFSGQAVRSTVDFSTLQLSDAAVYTCEVVITPREGNVPALTVSETMTLDVISESVLMRASHAVLKPSLSPPHSSNCVSGDLTLLSPHSRCGSPQPVLRDLHCQCQCWGGYSATRGLLAEPGWLRGLPASPPLQLHHNW